MKKDIENFKQNFERQDLKDQFRQVTGLDAKGNEAAFIGFINALSIQAVFNAVQSVNSSLITLPNDLQVMKQSLFDLKNYVEKKLGPPGF